MHCSSIHHPEATMTEPYPCRVDVLMRSIGRSTVERAVDSVLQQAGVHWRLIILAAHGEPLSNTVPGLDDPRVQLVVAEHSLGRGAAANRLLDLAQAEFALFLDDDDWILPGHLERLGQLLQMRSGAIAAYTGVRCVALEGGVEREIHTYDQDLDRVAMQLENQLPIHSTMFRLRSVREPQQIRFDDSLEHFEDWDFWLQLLRRGEFLRVPGVSAVYVLDPQLGSGHASVNDPRRHGRLAAFGRRQLDRWQGEDVADLIDLLAEQRARVAETTQKYETAQAAVVRLSDLIEAQREEAADMRVELEAHRTEAATIKAELETHRAEAISIREELEARRQEAVDMSAELALHRSEVTTIGVELETQRTRAATVDAQLNECLERVATVSAERDARRREAAAMSEELVAQGLEVTRLRQELAERQNAIVDMAAELETVTTAMHAYRTEAEHLAAVRSDLLRQVEALNSTLTEIHASTSWRVTRPVRAVSRAFSWSRTGRFRVFLGNARIRLVTEFRRHGWYGVLRRIPFYAQHRRRLVAFLGAQGPRPEDNPFLTDMSAQPTVSRIHPDFLKNLETLDQRVSVVIPTFNAGREFPLLLRKLNSQLGVHSVEIVLVDSGSTDSTVEAGREAGARLVEITQAEFNHSHARNLGAQAATGDLLLFMVQDAYPVGDYWIYAIARWLLDHANDGVVAASCSEYCRSDSDLMYESMVSVHYRFLGCSEGDRIGRLTGEDHMALRTQGQLSDVACMIDREFFLQYLYRGEYAEDLDLGIRLIKDGHAVAMLASVKVIHSHNRPAWYYLKRTFVDVVFLTRAFDDFEILRCVSARAMLSAMLRSANGLATWLDNVRTPGAQWHISRFRPREWRQVRETGIVQSLGDSEVDAFLRRLQVDLLELPSGGANQTEPFSDMLIGRLDHIQQYALSVYEVEDERVQSEFVDAVLKTFAGTVGAALAYFYLDRRDAAHGDPERVWIDSLFAQLKAGI